MKRSVLMIALLAGLSACSARDSIRLPLSPTYTFRQGEDAFARRDYAEAEESYRRFIDSGPDAAFLPRSYHQMALAQYQQQKYGAALASLDEMKQQVGGIPAVQTLALRGDIELALGKTANAIHAWEEAWVYAKPMELPLLEDRLRAAQAKLTNEERAEIDETIVVPPVREALGLAKTPAPMEQTVAVAPDSGTAPAAMNEPATGPEVVDSSEHEVMAASDGAMPSESNDTVIEPEPAIAEPEPATKVACLLPLTGPDFAYGRRALAGLRLAFADAPEQLIVRDTGGQPATGATLLKQLRADPKVMAVVGPLRSSEAEVAAPLAERDQLPMLLLSQREGLTGRFVLQVAMTRTQQTQLLTRYAVGTLKLQKFGIVYPDNAYGSGFADAFKDAVTAQGASVSGALSYEPGAPDFVSVTAAVNRWHQSGVDAVFIPDAARAATAVAAAVRDAVPDITLLGTESWNDATVLAKAGTSINGAIFTDAFFADSARPSTRQFVERFERGAGRPPTVFEAQAFDAGMVIRQVLSTGATSRDQVIGELGALGTFEGAGELHSTPAGFQRALSLLRYRDGRVEELTPGS